MLLVLVGRTLCAPTAFAARVPARAIADAALAQVGVTTVYDPAYVHLRYPGGDVPRDRGVCSDVVVRAFRAAGVDLQVALHEDMAANFRAYPKMWAMRGADANIDHRRVPNLMKFFERRGKSRPARDAYERGFEQVFVEDAMSGLTAVAHQFAIETIFPRMGRIRSTDDVLAAIKAR